MKTFTSLLIAAFGPNPDGPGTILRVWEQGGITGNVEVTLPTGSKFTSAIPVNLRGEKIGEPFKINDQLRANSGIFQLAQQLQTNNHIQLTGIKDKNLFNFIIDKKSLNVLDLVKNNQTLKFGFRASDEKYYYSVAFIEAFEKPGSAPYNDYPEVLKNALLKAEINSNPIVLVWEIRSF